MKNKNDSNTKIVFSIMIILIICSFAYSYFLNNKIDSNISELRDYKKNILESSQNFSSQINLEKETIRAKEINSNLDKIFLKEQDKVSFLEEIEKLSKDRGIIFEITSAIPDNTKTSSEGYGILKVGMKGSGDERALKSFVNDLQNLARAISFSSIRFSENSNKDPESGSWILNIDISVITK